MPEPPGPCATLQCVSDGVLWWCEWSAEIAQTDPTSRIVVVFVEIDSVAAQALNPENPSLDIIPFLSNMTYGDWEASQHRGEYHLSGS